MSLLYHVNMYLEFLILACTIYILASAFLDLGCSAMWCGYYDGNEKSKRCQEKCGFQYHHTEENKPCTLMGDVRTEHFTYLTKEQWYDKMQALL